MLREKKLAILGAGKIGEALIRGLLDAEAINVADVTVTAGHQQRLDLLKQRFGVNGTLSNKAAAESADIIVLSVKPQTVQSVVSEIAEVLKPTQLLISVAASVSTSFIENHVIKPIPVIRAMPNTPCQIKKGMTGFAAGKHASPEHIELAKFIFNSVGRTIVADEKHMDSITGLSASGPAFIYIVIESLAEAGVKVGLPRDMATELAAQTVLGAGAMVIETAEHPAKLKDMDNTRPVYTRDDTRNRKNRTARDTNIKAVVKSTQRAKDLMEN